MADKTIILIFRGEDHRNIRDHVHFGDLLSPLTEPLEHSRIDGHLRVSFQRTHEWEAELLLHWLGAGAVAGGSAVAAGVCAQFGAKIADLIWKWATSHVKQMRVNDKHIQSSQELAMPCNSKLSPAQMESCSESSLLHPNKLSIGF